MEKGKKSIPEYRFPLVIRPLNFYYSVIFVIVVTYIVLYGFAYFKNMALDSLMFKLLFCVMTITVLGIIIYVAIQYEFYIKLSDDTIKVKKLFKKDFTLRYSSIKSLSFTIETVNTRYVDVPNTFMIIVGDNDERFKFNISHLSDKMKGLVVEILYVKNPGIELNQIACNMKNGEYKVYRQVLDKTSYVAMVIGIIALVIQLIIKIFLRSG